MFTPFTPVIILWVSQTGSEMQWNITGVNEALSMMMITSSGYLYNYKSNALVFIAQDRIKPKVKMNFASEII